MKKCWQICLLLLFFCILELQGQTDSLSIMQPDTLLIDKTNTTTIEPITKSDNLTSDKETVTIKKDSIINISLTSDKFFAPSSTFKPNPRKAVIYSAIFPGLGQIYNRNYWKLPILYGGFIGFAYAISWNNGYYQLYFDAYKSIIDDDPDTVDWHNVVPYGQDPASIDQGWFSNLLKDRKDYFRYYRDFSIIGAVALYGLAIIDAYVDAQLFDFDMSPDLSMRITPTTMSQSKSSFLADSYGIQFSFNF